MIKIGDAVLEIKPDLDPVEKGFEKLRGIAKDVGDKIGGIFGENFDKGIKKIGEMGEKLKSIGKGATIAGAAITAVFAGVGGVALKTSSDLDAASVKMAASLGKPRAEAQGFRDDIKAIFKDNFGESIADVGDAATKVVSALETVGDASKENVRGITEGALAIRDAFDVDVGETLDAVTGLMENFGLSSEQALDFVAGGLQKGLNRSGDFIDSIREYGVQFKNAGADAGQFFSILETGLQSGNLGTDKAADLFKEFRVRIADGSETTRSALAAIGISAADLEAQMSSGAITAADAFQMVQEKLRKTDDRVVRFNAGVALMGTQFEDIGDEAALALDTTSTRIEDLTGSTGKLNDQYKNLLTTLGGLKRRAQLALDPIGEQIGKVIFDRLPQLERLLDQLSELAPQIGAAFATALDTIITKIVPIVQATAAWLVQHAELTKGVIAFVAVMGVLMSILGPFLVSLGAIGTSIPKAVSGFKFLKAGTLGVVSGIQTLLPFIIANGPLIVALGAVVIAVAAVGKAWLDLKAAQAQYQKSVEGVKNAAAKLADQLGEDVRKQVDAIDDLDQKIAFLNRKTQESIRSKYAAIIEEIKGAAATTDEVDRAILASIGGNITDQLDAHAAALVALNTETEAQVRGLLQKSKEEIDSFLTELKSGAEAAFGGVGDQIVSATAGQVDAIKQSASEFAQAQTEFTNATAQEFAKRRAAEQQFFSFSDASFEANAQKGEQAAIRITNADVAAHAKRTTLVKEQTDQAGQSASVQVDLWNQIGSSAVHAAQNTELTWMQSLDRILTRVGQLQAEIAKTIATSSDVGLQTTTGATPTADQPIPSFDSGGTQRESGLAFLHGNRTPELAFLPAGTRVLNPQQTQQALAPQRDSTMVTIDLRGATFTGTPKQNSEALVATVSEKLMDRGIQHVFRR